MHTLTVAFATPRHAEATIRFLVTMGIAHTAGSIDGGEGGDLATVQLVVDHAHVARVAALVVGRHGYVIRDRVAPPPEKAFGGPDHGYRAD